MQRFYFINNNGFQGSDSALPVKMAGAMRNFDDGDIRPVSGSKQTVVSTAEKIDEVRYFPFIFIF